MGAYEYDPWGSSVTEELDFSEFEFYPNPVRLHGERGAVIINYPGMIDESGFKLKIYNTKGQKVWESDLGTGYNGIRWDCSNTDGQIVAAGVYFLRLVKNGEFISQGKLTVVK
jgi:flagellar hook assembly protein FlgD